jgi:uncharacterized protein
LKNPLVYRIIVNTEAKMTKRDIVHIEIPTRNSQESADFYQKLFGWKMTPVPEMNYMLWEPAEGPGGGFSPLDEIIKPGDILIHVESEDIDADLKLVKQLGGQIIREKTEIIGVGWFAIFKDLTGNMIAVYTSKNPEFNKS